MKLNSKIISLILTIAILADFIFIPKGVEAAETLINPKDVINTRNLGTYAEHSIIFGLPATSLPIIPSDYIHIDLPYFRDPSEPTYISGDFEGTPVFSVLGTRIRITDISVPPGGMLHVHGIKAFNPTDPDSFFIWIKVSSDPDGALVRNSARIQVTMTDASVVMTAALESSVGVLRIMGSASPGMFINFTESETTIGTAVADGGGKFYQTFAGMPSGLHTVLLSGTDTENRATSSVIIEALTLPYELTVVSGLLMPPTLSLDKTEIRRGEPIVISGRGTPNYKAKIFTEPPLESFEVDVDNEGDYSYIFDDTGNLEFGDHKVFSLLQDGFGDQSLIGINVFFRVIDTKPVNPPADCDISQGNLNCDSSDLVNVVDFSILLYYWGGDNPAADINNDDLVNIIDFSIMMFYWTG